MNDCNSVCLLLTIRCKWVELNKQMKWKQNPKALHSLVFQAEEGRRFRPLLEQDYIWLINSGKYSWKTDTTCYLFVY